MTGSVLLMKFNLFSRFDHEQIFRREVCGLVGVEVDVAAGGDVVVRDAVLRRDEIGAAGGLGVVHVVDAVAAEEGVVDVPRGHLGHVRT